MGLMSVTATAPSTPAVGSTTYDNWPYQKALSLEKPSLDSATGTAVPSGTFCIPMPRAKAVIKQVNRVAISA
jgi:hypothetical protein